MPAASNDFERGSMVSQAAFSRHRSVSRKTVTIWKRRGMLVIDAEGKVDVERSDAMLDRRPAVIRGGVTSRRLGNS